MLTRLDHLVILVDDLDLAAADYERLGFAVTLGGEHADGLTRNALIPFDDGSYFELVSFLDPQDLTDDVSPLEGGDAAPGPMVVELTSGVRGSRELDPLLTHGAGIRLQSSEG